MIHRPCLTLLAGCLASHAIAVGGPPPATEKKPVVDELHGVKVTDSYRWLENWEDPAVKAWSEAQNAYARGVLDKVPAAEMLRARLRTLMASEAVSYAELKYRGGSLFAVKNQPPKQQPMIVKLASPDDLSGEQVLLDPNALDTTGGTAFDWYVPSPDGRVIAVSLSKGGSESGDVHLFSVADGKDLGEVVPRVNGGTAGGSLAWAADGKGFWYTRYPRAGDAPARPAEDMDFFQQVYFHALGTPTSQDRYEIGKDFPRIAEVMLESAGEWVFANVQKGDGGEFTQHLRTPKGTWVDLGGYADRVIWGTFGGGEDPDLYLVSIKDAPKGKVLKLSLSADQKPTLADAKTIVPEQKDAVIHTSFANGEGMAVSGSRLYVLYTVGGPGEVRMFDLSGKPKGVIPGEAVASVGGLAPYLNDELLFNTSSFITPPAWKRYSPSMGKTEPTKLVVTSPADYSDCEVVREVATSKDGTKVPMSIIRKKGTKLDGSNPTILWGYGGYGIVEAPTFSAGRRAWIEQGGVYVVANIRGGGEYGEEWHRQGNLTRKQNVFDDFAAVAEHLIKSKYCTKDTLALMGGSNGGLLMGAMITQHPELCKAVVSSVGIYDMLRVELSSNGAFNVTEFGTVKDPAHFKAMLAYSPLHNVKDGTSYPAVLYTTGANDPRVDPMQSRKMTARLQAADPKGLFLLRTSANTGHGMGSPLSSRIEQAVDTYGFLMWQLGINAKAVK